jgi:hypothetical protein
MILYVVLGGGGLAPDFNNYVVGREGHTSIIILYVGWGRGQLSRIILYVGRWCGGGGPYSIIILHCFSEDIHSMKLIYGTK